jgi:hypothetical protein
MPRWIRPGESLPAGYLGLPEFFEFDNWDGHWTRFNCGQAAACSLLQYYGRVAPSQHSMLHLERHFPPDNMGGWLGTSRRQVQRICDQHQVPLAEIRGEKELREALQNHRPALVMLQLPRTVRLLGISLPVGHWMVAYGYDERHVYLSNWGFMTWPEFRLGWRGLVPRLIQMHNRGLVRRTSRVEGSG